VVVIRSESPFSCPPTPELVSREKELFGPGDETEDDPNRGCDTLKPLPQPIYKKRRKLPWLRLETSAAKRRQVDVGDIPTWLYR
jgi:hypothetical protein